MCQQLGGKHSSSAMRYTQSAKQGESPPAYTPKYKDVLAKAGIFMFYHLGPYPLRELQGPLRCFA